jgi:DNA adenine methylase
MHTPFLKWAGGKRWLVPRLVKTLPPYSGRYIEPFLGSGAVFFAIHPSSALLSDANEDLIETYGAIRDDHIQVFELLKTHQRKHSEEYFYQMREYKPRDPYRKAARFIYLNRTCWNGLYRVNLDGVFNVPKGTKSTVLLDTDDWPAIAKTLQGVEIRCQDFETSIDSSSKGDLIFADPPYTVKHNLNGFIKYNNALFSWDDQIRLRDALSRAKDRGVHVIATNAYHESVRGLYREGFSLEALSRSSVLAGSAKHRGRYNELLIR